MLRRFFGWIFYAAMRCLVLLPFRWQLTLGRAVGRLGYWVRPSRREIARRNIAVCFPELEAAARERLLHRHFDAIGAGVAELTMGWFGSHEKVRRMVRVEGTEHLAAALERGHGVILFSAHFTTFELLFPALAPLCTRLCGMYKPQRNPFMDAVIRRGRLRTFDKLFTKTNVREMLDELAANSVVWYASDQAYGGKRSALLPFFGEPAMTNTAISAIARLSGAAVLPYFCRRLPGDAGYVIDIGAPLEDFPTRDAIADTARLTRLLEAYVRTCSEQYLWAHQRFKGRPAPYEDLYRSPRAPGR